MPVHALASDGDLAVERRSERNVSARGPDERMCTGCCCAAAAATAASASTSAHPTTRRNEHNIITISPRRRPHALTWDGDSTIRLGRRFAPDARLSRWTTSGSYRLGQGAQRRANRVSDGTRAAGSPTEPAVVAAARALRSYTATRGLGVHRRPCSTQQQPEETEWVREGLVWRASCRAVRSGVSCSLRLWGRCRSSRRPR